MGFFLRFFLIYKNSGVVEMLFGHKSDRLELPRVLGNYNITLSYAKLNFLELHKTILQHSQQHTLKTINRKQNHARNWRSQHWVTIKVTEYEYKNEY